MNDAPVLEYHSEFEKYGFVKMESEMELIQEVALDIKYTDKHNFNASVMMALVISGYELKVGKCLNG